jgi:hypothetical protein
MRRRQVQARPGNREASAYDEVDVGGCKFIRRDE